MDLNLLKILFQGFIILIGAIIINGMANMIGLPSWYDFLANPKLNLLSAIWLFLIYPFSLGLLVFLASRIL